MEYSEKLERLDKHLEEHPKDYQARIARLKTFSDAVEHEQHLRKVNKMKIISECKRIYG